MRAFLVFTVLAASACGHFARKPYPLYPDPQVERDPDGLATLMGPVARVDDQDVSSLGSTFALLPGCHIVTLRSSIGEGGMNGAWAAHLPPMVYAFRMRPGHRYVIDYRTDGANSAVGRIYINATDRDPAGGSSEVPLVASGGDLEACRAWAPTAGG